RPDLKKKKRRRQILFTLLVVIVAGGVAIAVSRLKPAAPSVDSSEIWTGTVKRGDMIRQVRGLGELKPRQDRIRLIPAQTDATVVSIRMLPGTKVQPDTVLMDLADPQLQQQLLNAQLALKAAQVEYHNMQVKLESDLMDKRSAAAAVSANQSQAELQAQTDQQLYKLGVISGLSFHKSESKAKQLTVQNDLEKEEIVMNQKAIASQLAVQQTKVEQAQAKLALLQNEQDALQVKAGINGVLIDLPHQIGEHVAVGTTLAEVVQPNQLMAELKIPETQAHDIELGQQAEIDTHNGIVPGHVMRIDPSVVNGTRTVDVAMDGPLPSGAVPDLSVDGTIDLQRLHDVLYVGRPAFGNENSTISLFRLSPNGKTATRVQVKVGVASVTKIQVLRGLRAGDRVILSDMSQYDNVDKVRLN
ncbi:MAG: efflux RND transporter periplasmic adaptor subunit, partial [Acidobacteria bacterium]|nr:efflux RND transporter periplasmic adaptor subunit [Acidobacteriota bacterium]